MEGELAPGSGVWSVVESSATAFCKIPKAATIAKSDRATTIVCPGFRLKRLAFIAVTPNLRASGKATTRIGIGQGARRPRADASAG
jgi:hypothetical protein